ncbi:uncharacterized protein LOC134266151 [Saccostrea cucullata]|uniref:uncharacterized protein LOC134266151 n=1 Tax=Saccostrea cuccullata TaxID=36930 RepID=UPI002ED42D91
MFGETVHVSSGHTPHSSGGSGVNPAVHTTASNVHHHDLCLHNHTYYRDIFRNAERDNCLSSYSVFRQLDYLRRTDHICASTLVKKMASLNLPSCTCSSRHIYYPYQKTYIYDASCRQDHHFQVWEDLLRLSKMNTRCLDDFISHMHVAYEHNHDPNCYHACQSSIQVSTTTKTTKAATQPSTATITTTTSATTTSSPSTTITTTQPTTTNSPSTTTTITSTTPTVTSTTSKHTTIIASTETPTNNYPTITSSTPTI